MSNDGFKAMTKTDVLANAMAPTDMVLDAFATELSNSQHDFAIRILAMWHEYGPSKRYLRNLVRRYIKRIEAEGQAVEDDDLLILVLKCSQRSDALPDPTETGYQSFWFSDDTADCAPLRVRVFPQHNDVSLRLWEAGGVLAEYLLTNPQYVNGKVVLETGAGVGLTGLVASRYCGAAKVLMTDYSVECLLNLAHNIAVNETWLVKLDHSPEVTQGFLDWEAYATDDCQKELALDTTFQFFQDADVLLAADVVYDIAVVPMLATLIMRFLRGREDRNAILATTLRNRKTFDLFESVLHSHKINCCYEDPSVIEKLPNPVTIHHVQPRSDIRICVLTIESC